MTSLLVACREVNLNHNGTRVTRNGVTMNIVPFTADSKYNPR
jgi:hypothetical protein